MSKCCRVRGAHHISLRERANVIPPFPGFPLPLSEPLGLGRWAPPVSPSGRIARRSGGDGRSGRAARYDIDNFFVVFQPSLLANGCLARRAARKGVRCRRARSFADHRRFRCGQNDARIRRAFRASDKRAAKRNARLEHPPCTFSSRESKAGAPCPQGNRRATIRRARGDSVSDAADDACNNGFHHRRRPEGRVNWNDQQRPSRDARELKPCGRKSGQRLRFTHCSVQS